MKYGLIGGTLKHSYSKAIHGFLGNDGYELKETMPDELEDFLKKADFLGINVTIPYKRDVMKYCVLSKLAEQIGGVNTIVKREGGLYGYNTDYHGFLYAAKRAEIDLAGKKVLILGGGGTSKTAYRAVKDSGAEQIVTVSRSGENNYENIGRHYDSQVVVNTTPVGMYPSNYDSPVTLAPFRCLEGVIDVIFNPLKTRLVLEAEEMGVKSTGGLPMLAAQALYAHKLFFGLEENEAEDTEKIAEILRKTEKMYANIVLIGMPGSGKSTVGQELAKRLNRRFSDTDCLIEKRIGKSPADIILQEGEPRFREIESEIVADTAKITGQVIATGGGAVLSKKNRQALLQNGFIVFLDKNINELAVEGRPLSKDMKAVEEMEKVRRPVYESLSHIRVEVTESVCENAANILKCIWS